MQSHQLLKLELENNTKSYKIILLDGVPFYFNILEDVWLPLTKDKSKQILSEEYEFFKHDDSNKFQKLVEEHKLDSFFDKTELVERLVERFGNISAMTRSAAIGGWLWLQPRYNELHKKLKVKLEQITQEIPITTVTSKKDAIEWIKDQQQATKPSPKPSPLVSRVANSIVTFAKEHPVITGIIIGVTAFLITTAIIISTGGAAALPFLLVAAPIAKVAVGAGLSATASFGVSLFATGFGAALGAGVIGGIAGWIGEKIKACFTQKIEPQNKTKDTKPAHESLKPSGVAQAIDRNRNGTSPPINRATTNLEPTNLEQGAATTTHLAAIFSGPNPDKSIPSTTTTPPKAVKTEETKGKHHRNVSPANDVIHQTKDVTATTEDSAPEPNSEAEVQQSRTKKPITRGTNYKKFMNSEFAKIHSNHPSRWFKDPSKNTMSASVEGQAVSSLGSGKKQT